MPEPGENAGIVALAAVEYGAQALGGTVAAAGVGLERGVPLVVVPTGTINDSARDLGMDLARPLRTLDAFGRGSRVRP